MKHVKLFEQFLNELVVQSNGWKKLALLMQKYPEAFPRITASGESYEMEEVRFVGKEHIDLDTLNGWSNMTSFGIDKEEMDEEDGLMLDIKNAIVAATKAEEENESMFHQLGLSVMARPDWIVDCEAGIRILPFGNQFGKKNWAANSRMMPFIGSGMEQTAQVSKDGWVLKRPKTSLTHDPIHVVWMKKKYDLMADHPELFAGVRGWNPKDSSFWQEKLDEEGWRNEDRADALRTFRTLKMYFNRLLKDKKTDSDDFSERHNIGLNKQGQLRIFDF